MKYKLNLFIYVAYLAIILFILFWGLFSKKVDIVVPQEVKAETIYQLNDTIPEEKIDELLSKYASTTSPYQIARMKKTIWCESGYKNVQSNVVRNGVRENSWGIVQIHLPSHPTVTKEQALDPEFAIQFIVKNWGKVRWYGLLPDGTCNNIYL